MSSRETVLPDLSMERHTKTPAESAVWSLQNSFGAPDTLLIFPGDFISDPSRAASVVICAAVPEGDAPTTVTLLCDMPSLATRVESTTSPCAASTVHSTSPLSPDTRDTAPLCRTARSSTPSLFWSGRKTTSAAPRTCLSPSARASPTILSHSRFPDLSSHRLRCRPPPESVATWLPRSRSTSTLSPPGRICRQFCSPFLTSRDARAPASVATSTLRFCVSGWNTDEVTAPRFLRMKSLTPT
mmetsp:Transcript_44702/g.112063  ORF Transcript_44702/g.112063 Transcript_44702/m.112063 type:complete len:242 (-) Transcript_44702:130-855(-)